MNTRISAVKAVTPILALCGFLSATETSVLAQRSPGAIQRRVDQLKRQGEQFERDNPERGFEDGSNKKDRRRSQALLVDARRNLESLQTGYNQIVLAMAAKKSVDDDEIVHAVNEIRQCSTRLKEMLLLPEAEADKPKPSGTATTLSAHDSLLLLRKHIYSFVMNPMFEAPAVVDVQQAQNAGRDLDRIIELSELISKQQAKKKLAQ